MKRTYQPSRLVRKRRRQRRTGHARAHDRDIETFSHRRSIDHWRGSRKSLNASTHIRF